jgi:hypothetical protein
MHASTITFALLSIVGFTMAAPTPVDVAPRCGVTMYPTILQQLTEDSPYTTNPNTAQGTNNFHVSQTVGTDGKVGSRITQVVGFSGIPSGAYGCQLNVKFEAGAAISTVGNPTLNVTTLYKDSPSSISYPNNWSWSQFYPSTSPPLGQGLFATTTLAPGQNSALNSQTCSGNLAFVFSIASWVSKTASVEFTESIKNGIYLTHSC